MDKTLKKTLSNQQGNITENSTQLLNEEFNFVLSCSPDTDHEGKKTDKNSSVFS